MELELLTARAEVKGDLPARISLTLQAIDVAPCFRPGDDRTAREGGPHGEDGGHGRGPDARLPAAAHAFEDRETHAGRLRRVVETDTQRGELAQVDARRRRIDQADRRRAPRGHVRSVRGATLDAPTPRAIRATGTVKHEGRIKERGPEVQPARRGYRAMVRKRSVGACPMPPP